MSTKSNEVQLRVTGMELKVNELRMILSEQIELVRRNRGNIPTASAIRHMVHEMTKTVFAEIAAYKQHIEEGGMEIEMMKH